MGELTRLLLDGWGRGVDLQHTVPVHGAIILNSACTKCLLVQGWGKSGTWGFPKGKVNKHEASAPCAVREVFEETGFDISSRLREENRFEKSRGLQTSSLYVIPDVPESTVFQCQTEKEIRQIVWFPVADLPPQGDRGAYLPWFGLSSTPRTRI